MPCYLSKECKNITFKTSVSGLVGYVNLMFLNSTPINKENFKELSIRQVYNQTDWISIGKCHGFLLLCSMGIYCGYHRPPYFDCQMKNENKALLLYIYFKLFLTIK